MKSKWKVNCVWMKTENRKNKFKFQINENLNVNNYPFYSLIPQHKWVLLAIDDIKAIENMFIISANTYYMLNGDELFCLWSLVKNLLNYFFLRIFLLLLLLSLLLDRTSCTYVVCMSSSISVSFIILSTTTKEF